MQSSTKDRKNNLRKQKVQDYRLMTMTRIM